jgi:hypothetical protein
MTDELKEARERALEAVRNDPEHDLSLGYRQAVWAALGPRNATGPVMHNAAHARRAKLAILTARKVLPMLKRARLGTKTPERLLQEAMKAIAGEVDADKLRDRAARYRTELDNKLPAMASIAPLYAGYAAIKAAFTALDDEEFDPDNLDYEQSDASRDAYHLDTAYLASLAYAGGASDETESDPEKRLEFWEWWLNEAVPAAQKADEEMSEEENQ